MNKSKLINGKKGAVFFYFLAIIMLFMIGYAIIFMSKSVPNLDYVGSSQKKIIDSYELAERAMLYLDINTKLAADKALLKTNQQGGATNQKEEDTKQEYICGILVYPLLNNGTNVEKCFPSIYNSFKEEFLQEFQKGIYTFPELPLYTYTYDAIISKKDKDLQLKVFSNTELKIPIYSDTAAYYNSQQITQRSTTIPPGTFVDTPEGYKKTSGYVGLSRGSTKIDTIVLHYTAGSTLQSALTALQNAGLSYHYIIDKDGTIYQLVDEDKSAQHAGCYRNGNRLNNCKDGYNSRSIGISFVNLGWDTKGKNVQCTTIQGQCWETYTDQQMNAAAKLIVDIQKRQEEQKNDLEINETTIIYHSDVYKEKTDPGPAFDKQRLLTIIKSIQQTPAQQLTNNNESTTTTNNNQQTTTTTQIISDQKISEQDAIELHNKITYDSLKNKKPAFTISPTTYYTPAFTDTGSWCSPTKGDCITNTNQIQTIYGSNPTITSCLSRNAGFCCIPESDRGFYEDTLCQGSGQYNNQIYKYNTITTNPSSSTPIKGYTRGQTSTGTDPIKQWTVAVNAKKGTNCYIPYNTLIYAYFGEGNPWNGVYRAEDTGAAFQGECKMDFYAGVGIDAVTEAKKYIDPSKTVQIYILNEKLEYIPTADLSSIGLSAQTGEIKVPYTFTYSLPGASELYEQVQKFVERTVNTCFEKPYAQKQTCVDEQINKTNSTKLQVSRMCLEAGFLPAINVTNLSNNYTSWDTIIKAGGQIYEKEPAQMTTTTVKDKERGTYKLSSTGYLKITQIPSNEPLTLKFPDQDALPEGFDWGSLQKDDYVEFTHLKVLSVDQSKNEITVKAFDPLKEKDKQAENINVNPGYFTREIMKSVATNLAECTTAEQDECKCNVAIWGLFENITFAEGKMTLTNMTQSNYVELSQKIYEQNESIQTNITPTTNTDFSKKLKYTDLRFKKNKNGSLTYINEDYEPDLVTCEPKNKYYLMCADTGNSQSNGEQTQGPIIDEDALRFSIKI